MQAKSSLTEAAYRTIRFEVVSCRLMPGQKLLIAALCERLGYSLGAVREALARLTSEGFVAAEPQRGFRVASISEADLRDLTETRAMIEGRCLERAIAAGDGAWDRAVVASFEAMLGIPQRDPGDPARLNEAWAQAHAQFHATLVQPCDSAWLLRLREQLYAQSERYRRLSVPLARAARDLDREHRGIMEAALVRQTDDAVAKLREHLAVTTNIIIASELAGQGTDRDGG